jgi:acyl dehydratase
MSTQLHPDDRVTPAPTPATPASTASTASTRLATRATGAEITDYRNVIRTATGPGPALGPDRWTASPVHPFVLAWKAFDRAVADVTSVGSGVVHLSQEIHQERPLRADEPVTLDLAVVGARRDPRGVRLALRSRLTGEDGRVFAELVTGLLALGATGPEPFGTIPPPPAHGSGGWDTVVETTIPAWLPQYYAEISGDHNPIHLDAGAARAAGFPGVIAHGMSVIAVVCEEVIDRYCGGDAGRVRGVGGRFSSPVVPDQPLTLSFAADPADGTVRFGCATPDGLAVKQGWVRIAGAGDGRR